MRAAAILAFCLLAASGARGGDARVAVMESLRAKADALDRLSERLEGAAAGYARDADPPADREDLRHSAEAGAKRLREDMADYWTLDDADRVRRGAALVSAMVNGVPVDAPAAVREVADLGDFPRRIEGSFHRAEKALAQEEAAHAASAARRARDRNLRLAAGAVAAAAVAAAAGYALASRR